MNHDDDDRVREIIKQLQSPVADVHTLLGLLTAPLDCLGLLPPRFRPDNVHPLPDGAVNVRRHIQPLQRILLEEIYPTWEPILTQMSAITVVDQYFCPDSFHCVLAVSGSIALQAISTLLSTKLSSYSVLLLERLTRHYPIDRMYQAIVPEHHETITWEDYIQNSVAIPAKVANHVGDGELPSILRQGNYFRHMFLRFDALVAAVCPNTSARTTALNSLTFVITKWVHLGLFPATPPALPSESSFFQTVLPSMRHHVLQQNREYLEYWSGIVFAIPSMITSQTVLASLFGSLERKDFGLADEHWQKVTIKKEALFLYEVLGAPNAYDGDQLDLVISVILGRNFEDVQARVFVCWMAYNSGTRALEIFLDEVVTKWSLAEHIKHSLLSHHRYLTTLLVLAISYLGSESPVVRGLASDGRFITGVSTYIGHMDKTVRMCGMLAAEIVASFSGKQLDFGVWDGDEPGKAWVRQLRRLVVAKDGDTELDAEEQASPPILSTTETEVTNSTSTITVQDLGYDSDDSIAGYASPSSSRSPSPTPSEMEEREKDPSLNVTAKTVPRPVYLAQLGELLREPTAFKQTDGAYDADRMEVALREGESLIRRKQFFGTELDENAVNLVHGYLNLQDKFELDGFEVRCQEALIALVACCPTKAAPCIAEEFFKNQYSIQQRYMMLNALVMGARQLSGQLPQTSPFPSKLLPPALHEKYLPEQDKIPASRLLDDGAQASNPGNRTRRLRMQKAPLVTELSKSTVSTPPSSRTHTFTSVATEHFIGPLMNRFWLFLRDEQAREERTAHLHGRQQYYGAGSGLILNPTVLGYFISAMTVLVHLARNALEWSAVVAPDVLELALAIGTRPVSRLEEDEDLSTEVWGSGALRKQASVLTAVLELVVVVLDAALESDDGRSLSLEHPSLILGVGEWASALFERLDKGERAQGTGGKSEINLPNTCAAVVIKVDALTSKWRRSMIDVI